MAGGDGMEGAKASEARSRLLHSAVMHRMVVFFIVRLIRAVSNVSVVIGIGLDCFLQSG